MTDDPQPQKIPLIFCRTAAGSEPVKMGIRKHVVGDLPTALLSKLSPEPSNVREGYNENVREAYKKHAAELASIEDRVNKMVLVILGVFGAGATLISGTHLSALPAGFLVVVVAAITWIGVHYSLEMRSLRKAVRDLLVRCEMAMDFYKKDAYLHEAGLYTCAELDFPKKGGFLTVTYAFCIFASGVGLIVLIIYACFAKTTPIVQPVAPFLK